MKIPLRTTLLVLALASPAIAEDATTWKSRGDKAMDEGRAAEALGAYRQAAAIAPSPSLDYNIGRALLATGDFVGALDAFEHYASTAPEDLKKKTHRLAEVMADIRSKIVTVEVTGDSGARVSIDGKVVCSIPCASLRHNPGVIEVRAEADERQPWSEQRDVPPGTTARFEAVLVPVPTEARLVIATRPPTASAKVTVDGKVVGVTPISLTLPPGTHDVALDAASFEPRRTTIVLGRAESRRVDVELTPEKPITKRWWFWTGIAVGVVGGIGAAIALTTERSERTGSLGTVHVP